MKPPPSLGKKGKRWGNQDLQVSGRDSAELGTDFWGWVLPGWSCMCQNKLEAETNNHSQGKIGTANTGEVAKLPLHSSSLPVSLGYSEGRI